MGKPVNCQGRYDCRKDTDGNAANPFFPIDAGPLSYNWFSTARAESVTHIEKMPTFITKACHYGTKPTFLLELSSLRMDQYTI